jgi:hypothetical protein
MHKLKQAVESACSGDTTFNSCLLNLYRDGSDHVPWHADDEPVYGDLTDCTIASVSLGAPRLFQIRQNSLEITGDTRAAVAPADCVLRRKYMLHNGSLLVMRGATQRHYQHRVPKRERRPVGPRINATFRTIKIPEATCEPEAEFNVQCTDDYVRGQLGAGSDEDDEDDEDEDDEDDDGEALADGPGGSGSTRRTNCTSESSGFQQRHVRFAARRLSERLFIGHGQKKLCPRGAASLRAAVHDAAANAVAVPGAHTSQRPLHLYSAHRHDVVGSLIAGADGVSSRVSPDDSVTVTLEMHRGYAFANLTGIDCPQTGSLRVIAALDGVELNVPPGGRTEGSTGDTTGRGTVASGSATTDDDDSSSYTLVLDVCPATQPVCKHFTRTGSCRFGERCHFAHIV